MKGIYFLLEIKRALKSVGVVMLSAVILVILIGGAAFTGSKLLYQDTIIGRVSVAVVQEEENALNGMALSMLSSMNSVSSFCDFIFTDQEEALHGLESNKYYAVLKIPQDMIQSVLDGRNLPAVVLVPEDIGVEASIFRLLADAGADTLGAAQAGVYAAYDYLQAQQMESFIKQAEDELNQVFLDYAMSRSVYFSEEPVSVTGDLTVGQFYAAFGIVLFLLLCGIPCSFFLGKRPAALEQKLRTAGIRSGLVTFARITAVAVLLMVTAAFLTLLGILILGILRSRWIIPTPLQILLLLPVFFAAAGLIVLAYQAAGNPVSGVMLLFLGSIIMIFCSGGFLPAAFLPAAVQKVSAILPTAIMAKQAGSLFTGVPVLSIILQTLGIGLLAGIISTLTRRERL